MHIAALHRGLGRDGGSGGGGWMGGWGRGGWEDGGGMRSPLKETREDCRLNHGKKMSFCRQQHQKKV